MFKSVIFVAFAKNVYPNFVQKAKFPHNTHHNSQLLMVLITLFLTQHIVLNTTECKTDKNLMIISPH